ncbi:hypothetical protein FA15DRAFT_653530 [Coprinopsis marcescibilis]|uniref:Uncharacterized protein n=1 Tax=Coprinopsis marcescibilis TaxID=230819 RepID=A0A5C3L5N1_COPMA|nr:hypothetical protein FA15DRAFT_653530 [Coprinopsis marcescibilis]
MPKVPQITRDAYASARSARKATLIPSTSADVINSRLGDQSSKKTLGPYKGRTIYNPGQQAAYPVAPISIGKLIRCMEGSRPVQPTEPDVSAPEGDEQNMAFHERIHKDAVITVDVDSHMDEIIGFDRLMKGHTPNGIAIVTVEQYEALYAAWWLRVFEVWRSDYFTSSRCAALGSSAVAMALYEKLNAESGIGIILYCS